MSAGDAAAAGLPLSASPKRPQPPAARQVAHPVQPTLADALVEELATAVAAAGTNALLLDAANRKKGWTSIPQAVVGGRVFAVQVRHDLLAVDLDTTGVSPGEARRRRAGFDELTTALAELPMVLVASGRPGHRHLFAVVGTLDPAVRERLVSACRRRGLDVRAMIRPPLSPHRRGAAPQLLSPTTPTDAVAALTRPAPPAATVTSIVERLSPGPTRAERRASRPRPRRPLSQRIAALLRDGDLAGRYATRSEAVQAITLGAWNAGWTQSELVTALLDTNNSGGARVRQQPDPAGYVERSWRKACQLAEIAPPISDPSTARAALAELSALADTVTSRWSGRSGLTDRKVLEAHLRIAVGAAAVDYSASTRQIAETAGVDRKTVTAAHRRLTADGWLASTQVGAGTLAGRWRLPDPAVISKRYSPSNPHTPPACGASGGATHPQWDAWRWRGMGASAWQVHRHLSDHEEVDVRALSEGTGLHTTTVRRALARLHSVGLAVHSEHGWRRADGDLQAAAERWGTAGARARQRAAHEAQRAAWRAWLAGAALRCAPAPARVLTDPDTGKVWLLHPTSGQLIDPDDIDIGAASAA